LDIKANVEGEVGGTGKVRIVGTSR
jgi:hypothetical protein